MIYLDIPNNQGPIDLYKWVEEDFMTAFREHLANKGESMTTTVQNLEAWRAAAPMRRVLKNLERFTRSAVDWPTPMLSDAEIEHWAQRYEFYELRRRGRCCSPPTARRGRGAGNSASATPAARTVAANGASARSGFRRSSGK